MRQIRIHRNWNNNGVINQDEARLDIRDVRDVPSASWQDDVGASFEKNARQLGEQLDRAVSSVADGLESLDNSLDPRQASYDQSSTKRYIASLCPR